MPSVEREKDELYFEVQGLLQRAGWEWTEEGWHNPLRTWMFGRKYPMDQAYRMEIEHQFVRASKPGWGT